MKYNVNLQFGVTCLALVALSASLLLTSCNDSMLGADMDSLSPDTIIIAPPPIHHVIIESIEILEIPARAPNGEHWDHPYGADNGPDLGIQLRAVGEDPSAVSEFLSNSWGDQYDDYMMQASQGTCIVQLTDVSLSAGDLPFHVPLNFEGFLELVDRDVIPRGLAGLGSIPFNNLMTAFEFHPAEYKEDLPHSILLTSLVHCQHSIRLQVRWI